MSIHAYHGAQTVADTVFDQEIPKLSKELAEVIEQHAARGFSSMDGIAVGKLIDVTRACLDHVTDLLVGVYNQSLVEVPFLEPEARSAAVQRLAGHVGEQLRRIVSMGAAKMARRDAMPEELTQKLAHCERRIRDLVKRISGST